jgi:hypothetical protein
MSLGDGLKHVFIKLRSGWQRYSSDGSTHFGDAMSYVGGGGSGLAQMNVLGGGGMASGSIGSVAQANPYADNSWATVINRTNVAIEQVENGYIVTIDNKRYICETAESSCQQILTQMVAKKMEK